jgi:hypothetical protein
MNHGISLRSTQALVKAVLHRTVLQKNVGGVLMRSMATYPPAPEGYMTKTR